MSKLFILLCFEFLVFPLFSSELSFYKEDIVFEISEDSIFSVSGDYYFRNDSTKPIRQLLFYPFPQDSRYGKIIQIEIADIADSTKIPLLKSNEKGATFRIEIQPRESKIYHIFYQQKIKSNQAEYILLTTQHWKAPFEEVKYQLIIPETMKIKYLSYNPDNSGSFNNKKIYFWNKQKFMPDRNFILRFY